MIYKPDNINFKQSLPLKVRMWMVKYIIYLALGIGSIHAQADMNNNLPTQEERTNLDLDFDFNKELLVEAAGQFFDLENAGNTKLGQIMAWKGDLLQPVILVGMGIFTIYTGLRIILVILSGILDIKSSIAGSVVSLFQRSITILLDKILMIKNPIIEKINAFVNPDNDDSTPAAERSMRALEDVAEFVLAALNKYD